MLANIEVDGGMLAFELESNAFCSNMCVCLSDFLKIFLRALFAILVCFEEASNMCLSFETILLFISFLEFKVLHISL